MRLADGAQPGQLQHLEHLVERFELVHQRRFMHAKQHARPAHGSGFADAAIGQQHELLDQFMALEMGPTLDPDHFTLLVHHRLGFG